MIYLQLFYEFAKAGLFAIGGGLATLPFLYDIGARTGWFSNQAVVDMLAVSESTPGPIGVNMATYTGFLSGGVLGSVVATVGLITPSVIVILLVAQFLKRFKENSTVQTVFYALRPASTGLIAAAGFGVLQLTLFRTQLWQETGLWYHLIHWKSLILGVILYVVIKLTKKHPVVYIAGAGMVGILFQFAG